MKHDRLRLNEVEAEALFATVVDKSIVGIIIADSSGRYIYCNEIYESITGLSPDTVLKMGMHDMARRSEGGISATQIVLETKEEVFVVQRVLMSGKRHLTKAYPVFDDSGEVCYVVNNLLDVSGFTDMQADLAFTHSKSMGRNVDFSKVLEVLNENEGRELIYASQKMGALMDTVDIIARTDATVLITGESGAGKELIAKEIHNRSSRSSKPYLLINCSAIPESLLESELFGYEPGTFTGGNPKGKMGLIEAANGGTLFLDEIGDMPLALQVKLLRPLQEKEITRLGSTGKSIKVDVRFIAATNSDLKKKVEDREFREDLFYRLNVAPIEVPPLRERPDDIPLLAQYFVDVFNSNNDQHKQLTESAFEYLRGCSFPGNVRQLKNLIERACILSLRNTISGRFLGDLYDNREETQLSSLVAKNGEVRSGEAERKDFTYMEYLEDFEAGLFRKYAEKYNNTYRIAEALGLSQPTVSRKLKKYGIKKLK